MITVKESSETKRTFIHIDRLPGATSRNVRAALHDIGSESVSHLRRMLKTGERTGRMYGRHRASAPGEPPAARPNSRLTRTLRYTVRGDYQCEFGDTAPYGGFLEEGTRKMAPRPHVSRTAHEKQQDVLNISIKALDPKRAK